MKNRKKTKPFSYRKSYVKKSALSLTTSFILIFSIATRASAQEKTTISLNLENVSLHVVFTEIEKQSSYRFLYNDQIIDVNQKVTIKKENETLDNILNGLLPDLHCSYTIMDDNLVIIKPENNKQKITVTGQVIDDILKTGVPGANVYIKSTTLGTVTDVDGKYIIDVPAEGSVLVFSSLGYTDEERIVDKSTNIDIRLTPSFESLEEVVVVGYGTINKKDLTGSISKVKGEDIAIVSGANPIQALQGRAAGVAITTDNRPGEEPTIRIRGSGSITAGNDPLIVVDGFPLVDWNLNDFNPNDIESVDILKDASATAIYGSRGANGVIMITTKKGVAGLNNLTINSYYGVQTPARLVEMINRDEFISFINDAYSYSRGQPVYRDTTGFFAPENNTNWQEEIILDNSSVQEHSLTFSGGNESTTYMISSGLFSQDGLISNSGHKRINARTNLQHEFNNWLTVGTHIHTSRSEKELNDGSLVNIFRWGWPTMPITNDDDTWYYASLDPQHAPYVEGNWNPVADRNELTNRLSADRLLGDIYAEIKLAEGLTWRSNFGTDISNGKKYYYASSNHSAGMSSSGKAEQEFLRKTTRITENILTYSKTTEIHRLTLTGVYSYQDYMYESMKLNGTGFPTDLTGANNMELMNSESVNYESDKYSSKLSSWTTRAVYALQDKYILTATGRYDGSSRFGENNKWAFFPSVGLGWRINEEPFMSDIDQISNLKIHTSFGITGNQEIDNYASLPRLNDVNYVYGDSPILGFKEGLGNPDLKWEKTAQFDIGLDVAFFNRVNLVFAYYKRNTTDLLYKVPIPTTSGFSSMLQNIGEVENAGFEFSADARLIDSEFKWNIGFNLSKNKNLVIELYGDVDRIRVSESQGIAEFLIVGEPVNSVWARESKGIIKTQQQLDSYSHIRSNAQLGEEMYADNEADSSINSDDYINIGTTEPDFFYGISTSLHYKGFTLDIYAQGAAGIASRATDYLIYGDNQIQNRNYIPSKYAYDHMWSENNTNGDFPRAGAQEVYLSDRTNGNRSYFIIKNIRLSYNLKSSILNNSNWVKDITVFANLQNFVSYSNFRGYNPENGDIEYPLAKAAIIGINANF